MGNGALSAAGGVKKMLFDWGMSSKKSQLANGGPPTNGLWDAVLFGKIRARLGGRVRYIITGSAPLSAEVHRFLQVCFCCPVIQGYGMTETTAVVSTVKPFDHRPAHVGPPIPNCEIRLESVPEMSYLVTDDPPRGEVVFRGPAITKGYYKNDEETGKAIDEDGWFHSGDVGTFLPDGCLKIIDRKKNIFKLAQGEYVAAEYVENVYLQMPDILQVFIYGDSLQSALVAVVVPDPETLGKRTAEEVCADDEWKADLLKRMTEFGRSKKLKGYELARAIHCEAEPFSVDNNILTPTFKLKRPVAKKHYQKEIDAMYASLSGGPSK